MYESSAFPTRSRILQAGGFLEQESGKILHAGAELTGCPGCNTVKLKGVMLNWRIRSDGNGKTRTC